MNLFASAPVVVRILDKPAEEISALCAKQRRYEETLFKHHETPDECQINRRQLTNAVMKAIETHNNADTLTNALVQSLDTRSNDMIENVIRYLRNQRTGYEGRKASHAAAYEVFEREWGNRGETCDLSELNAELDEARLLWFKKFSAALKLKLDHIDAENKVKPSVIDGLVLKYLNKAKALHVINAEA